MEHEFLVSYDRQATNGRRYHHARIFDAATAAEQYARTKQAAGAENVRILEQINNSTPDCLRISVISIKYI